MSIACCGPFGQHIQCCCEHWAVLTCSCQSQTRAVLAHDRGTPDISGRPVQNCCAAGFTLLQAYKMGIPAIGIVAVLVANVAFVAWVQTPGQPPLAKGAMSAQDLQFFCSLAAHLALLLCPDFVGAAWCVRAPVSAKLCQQQLDFVCSWSEIQVLQLPVPCMQASRTALSSLAVYNSASAFCAYQSINHTHVLSKSRSQLVCTVAISCLQAVLVKNCPVLQVCSPHRPLQAMHSITCSSIMPC